MIPTWLFVLVALVALFGGGALAFLAGQLLERIRASRGRRPPAEPRLGAGTGKWFYLAHQEVQVLAAVLTDYLERTAPTKEGRGIPPWRLVAEIHRRVTLQATLLTGRGNNAVCRECGEPLYRHRAEAAGYDGHPFRGQWWFTDEDLEAALTRRQP